MKWPTCKTANAEFKDGMLKVQAYGLFPTDLNQAKENYEQRNQIQ